MSHAPLVRLPNSRVDVRARYALLERHPTFPVPSVSRINLVFHQRTCAFRDSFTMVRTVSVVPKAASRRRRECSFAEPVLPPRLPTPVRHDALSHLQSLVVLVSQVRVEATASDARKDTSPSVQVLRNADFVLPARFLMLPVPDASKRVVPRPTERVSKRDGSANLIHAARGLTVLNTMV